MMTQQAKTSDEVDDSYLANQRYGAFPVNDGLRLSQAEQMDGGVDESPALKGSPQPKHQTSIAIPNTSIPERASEGKKGDKLPQKGQTTLGDSM